MAKKKITKRKFAGKKKAKKKIVNKTAKKTTKKKVTKKSANKKSGGKKKSPAKKSAKKTATQKKILSPGQTAKQWSQSFESTRGLLKLSEMGKAEFTVVYFYPKDSTPGCTTEGVEFSENIKQFKSLKAEIVGVSKDSLKSHEKFKSKYGFKFDLVSDPDEKLCRSFGVIQKKNLYGREYMGIVRSTFVIDRSGTVLASWEKVKVKGHVEEVLNSVRSLYKSTEA